MERIYHPYWKWECYKNGMWRKESKEYDSKNIKSVIEFTSNYVIYGEAMHRAVKLWKYSCDNFLSNESINKLAYIGHAGCCIVNGWPEYLVRIAWKELTDNQRFLANKEAEKAIRIWKQKKESEIILRIGNVNVTKMEYQTRLLLN